MKRGRKIGGRKEVVEVEGEGREGSQFQRDEGNKEKAFFLGGGFVGSRQREGRAGVGLPSSAAPFPAQNLPGASRKEGNGCFKIFDHEPVKALPRRETVER